MEDDDFEDTIKASYPLFLYLFDDTHIDKIKLIAYISALEEYMNKIPFDDTITANEAIHFHNNFFYNKTVVKDPKFYNSEAFMIMRYILMICAVDSYGRCETMEGLERALQRGKQFLELGILERIINMLSAKKYADDFMNWKSIKDSVLTMRVPTSFTNLNHLDRGKIDIMNKEWRESLRVAFDMLAPSAV